jgi:uncharacterized protein (TIGR03435 family)
MSPSITMPVLARLLMLWTDGAEVRDETNLPGAFQVALRWTPDHVDPVSGERPAEIERAIAAIDPNGPTLSTALQEQLGLRLRPQKEPVACW